MFTLEMNDLVTVIWTSYTQKTSVDWIVHFNFPSHTIFHICFVQNMRRASTIITVFSTLCTRFSVTFAPIIACYHVNLMTVVDFLNRSNRLNLFPLYTCLICRSKIATNVHVHCHRIQQYRVWIKCTTRSH